MTGFITVQLAFMLTPGERLFVVAFIAAWLVLMCLTALAHEMEHAIRCHKLKVEVHTLRLQQFKRMRDMGMGKKRH